MLNHRLDLSAQVVPQLGDARRHVVEQRDRDEGHDAQDGAAAGAKKTQEGNPEKDEKKDKDAALSKFMRQKLHASNQILEGLCTEDLTMVQEGAKVMTRMSHEERWRVSSDMMYRRYSNEFISAVDELEKDAEANDLNKASLAWVNVTMKCLKCHEWVRNTVVAEK